MASGFLTLEDGRCFARRMWLVTNILHLINEELKKIPNTREFSLFLEEYIPDPDDESNGYGGFIRKETGESIMVDIDLRELAPENRTFFWQAAQKALNKQHTENLTEEKSDIFLLTYLLDMHKRIVKGEPYWELSDCGKNIT